MGCIATSTAGNGCLLSTVLDLPQPLQGQCGYGTSIDVLAQQRRQEWAIGANVGRIASSTVNSSLGMDGHGHSSEQHSSQRQQQSAWFSGQVLKPFIERDTRQAELEDARRCVIAAVSTLTKLGSVSDLGPKK